MGQEKGKSGNGSLVAVLQEPGDWKQLPKQTAWVYLGENFCQKPQPERLQSGSGTLKTIIRLPPMAGGTVSLAAQTEAADLVDIHDPAHEASLEAIPPERRLITRTVPAEHPELNTIAGQLTAIPAAFHRLILPCRRTLDAVVALELAKNHRGLIAYATGKFGAWTQILNGFQGSPLIFASAAGTMDAAGHFPLKTIIQFYGLPARFKVRKLYGILGDSAMDSLAPVVANEYCRKRELRGLYLPLVSDTTDCNWLPQFTKRLAGVGVEVGGFTVVAPNKTAILKGDLPVRATEAAKAVGAANLLMTRQGQWHADTSDTLAAIHSLARHQVTISGRSIAVVGRGGAGRAAVRGFVAQGAHVVLINRDVEKGKSAAEDLGVPFQPLNSFCPGEFDILIHCTPVGRDGHSLPFPLNGVKGTTVILDFAYRSGGETPLIQAARKQGVLAISGREILKTVIDWQMEQMTA